MCIFGSIIYSGSPGTKQKVIRLFNLICKIWQFFGKIWQIFLFFVAKFGDICGKIWQNLGFQMAIFHDASPRHTHFLCSPSAKSWRDRSRQVFTCSGLRLEASTPESRLLQVNQTWPKSHAQVSSITTHL